MSLGQAVVDVGADTSRFEGQLVKGVESAAKTAAARANSSLSTIGKNTTQVGKRLSLTLTTPIVGIGVAAVRSQASFEQSMKLIGVNAGIGGQQLANMGKLAQKLGADTVYSAGEAADAMLELSKGGFKPAEIAGGGVQATMALAATEGLNLADAATITGNAMNAFGLKAKNAAQIADALAAGSVASSASVASLAEGLGNVGPIARQSGLSLQDTVAALAELDQAGIKGAEGGTALRSFLTRLVPQGKRARDAMQALGLSFQDSSGHFKTIGQISDQLHTKLGKLSQAEKAERLQQIFGTYAKQAAAVFLSGGAKAYQKYEDAVRKSGTAQKLSDARMSGTAGAIERMKGSVDTATLALGTALAPTVIRVAGTIEKLANWFTNLDPAIQKDVAIVGGMVAAIGPLLVVGGSIISVYSKASSVITSFSTSMATAETRSAKLASAAKMAAGVGGMLALADGMRRAGDQADTTQSALGALETVAGGAAIGFSVGGPLGAGVGALGGLFGALAKEVSSSRNAVDHHIATNKTYAASLDGVTAAITRETRAAIYDRLQKNGLLDQTQKLGIADNTVIQAVTGSASARAKLVAVINSQTDATKRQQAINIVGKLLGETTAINASRLAQLQKNVAIAKTKGEVDKAQAALDKFSRTHANATIGVKGTTVAINQVNSVRSMISELTGHTHIVSMKVNVTGKPPSSMAALLGAGSNATGTSNWRGGWTMVGERGRELVQLPRGTQILSNTATERALANAAKWTPPAGRQVARMPDYRLGPMQTHSTSAVSHTRSASLTIINPVPETTTQSLPRALSNLAFVMGG